MLDKNEIIPFIMDLFARRGAEEYMGEPVSMAQHMQQTAACAVADNASNDLIVAALLHDIGHFVGDFPIDALENGLDNNHESVASQFLEPYFPESVTEPIRLHVLAKKYLCATDKNYYFQLSDASKQSLEVQGGVMNSEEVKQFESNRYYREAIQLRKYDDDGKVADKIIHPVTHYQSLIRTLIK